MIRFGLISFIAIFTLASCVSGKRFKELETLKLAADHELDSLRKRSHQLGAENADYEIQTQQLKSAKAMLVNDTAQLGMAMRDLNARFTDAQAQQKLLEENYNKLLGGRERETRQLMQDLREMQARLIEREDSLDLLAKNLADKSKRLEELERILNEKEEEVRRIRTAVAEALRSFEGSGLTVIEKNGKVYVSMSDKLLFESGSDVVDAQGQKALNELAKVLAREKGLQVTIEGHTDNVPIRQGGRIRDNWELSTMRANAIIRLLVQTDGVEPARLTASGRGEFLPLVANDTPENKSKNRRTEIIITPKLDDLFRILENN
jgi:chemotaxis protein MotB